VTEAVLDIKRWGNSLGVRLPAAVARAAHLHEDQRVRLSLEDGHVVIRPQGDAPLSLSQRLSRYDPARHGGEEMASGRLGAERW
jgi:antitoxin MazE